MRSRRLLLIGAVLLILTAALASIWRHREPPPKSYLTTEILVLGDSQLSFGAGPVLKAFFSDLSDQCDEHIPAASDLALLSEQRFAMIGTRSTSLQSWVTTSGRAWELLCHKDKRWGVNASTWGTVKPIDKRYVQIGEGERFQFCTPVATPLEQLFAAGYYTPRLLMMFVGGNGAGRIARDPAAAASDVQRFIERLPAEAGCLFMMTAPIFSSKHNSTRVTAQANLKAAFARHGSRCSFVEGHTPQTRSAIEGHKQFFRRNDAGDITDPYHANKAAAARFLALRKGDLCRALVTQFKSLRP